MAVRVYEPPMSVNLFDAEEAYRLRPSALVAAAGAIPEIPGVRLLSSSANYFSSCSRLRTLRGQVGVGPLSKFVEHRLAFQEVGARVFLGELPGLYFQCGFRNGILRREAERFDALEIAKRPPDRYGCSTLRTTVPEWPQAAL